jgi:hypothetical protein
MAAQQSSVVIRPSASAFAKRAALGLIVAWPLLLLEGMVRSHQLGVGQAALIATATVAALALVAAVYFLNVRVVVTDEQVIVRRMSGRERRWPRDMVQGCLLISVLLAVRPTKMIVVHAAHHQFLFSLTADLWDDRALRAITHALGYRHHGTATFSTISKEELLERYPAAYRQVWGPSAWLQALLFVLFLIAVGLTVQSLVAVSR